MADTGANNVKLLCLDVDGVLTDGSIYLDEHGAETKRFHVRDGAGIVIWLKLGFQAAIISGRESHAVRHRASELGIRHVRQGAANKMKSFRELLDELGLSASEAAVIGDDLADLPLMKAAGYPIAVADAAAELRAVAKYVTSRPGGCGAVREAVEHILRAKNRWEDALALFGRELI